MVKNQIEKSKILGLTRNGGKIMMRFETDEKIICNLEKVFNKLIPTFSLANYKKKYAGKFLENAWELQKNKELEFYLVKKRDFVKLKLTKDASFVQKFIDGIWKYASF